MSQTTPPIAGCAIEKLDQQVCNSFFAWLEGGTPPTSASNEMLWALAHSDAGVTWGRYDKQQQKWLLGSTHAPHISPALQPDALQELRLFGLSTEIFVWRTSDGLLGRCVCDDPNPTEPSLKPSEEKRFLRGDQIEQTFDGEFTHLRDKRGLEQVLPLHLCSKALPVQLTVKHYFQTIESSGAVRVALTRLVNLGEATP
jgi:CRISPR-associated protein (TIGR03984 family)